MCHHVYNTAHNPQNEESNMMAMTRWNGKDNAGHTHTHITHKHTHTHTDTQRYRDTHARVLFSHKCKGK